MIARCARCQGTFTTDRFGRQKCPHCGSELLLADPNVPAGSGQGEGAAPPPAGGPPPPPPGGPQAPPPGTGAPPGGFAPPPAAPPGGGWGPPGAPPPGGGGWGGPPPPPPPELPSPFAERATRGFFASFFETWKLVATQPQDFFRRVRIDQTGTAILFGVLASTVGQVVAAFYRWLFAEQFRVFLLRLPGADPRVFERFGEMSSGRGLIGEIVFAPLATVVMIYLSAAVFHVLLMLFRGANRPFDATLTAVAYASGMALLLVIPGCGSPIAIVWWLVVLIIGLGESQRCGSGKAAAAVLSPAILLLVCCCGALGLSMPTIMKSLGETARQGKGSVDL